ncbi:hypothetical protein AB0C00_30910, partial [Micromonospora carbonacea]
MNARQFTMSADPAPVASPVAPCRYGVDVLTHADAPARPAARAARIRAWLCWLAVAPGLVWAAVRLPG